jgi:hypothetical protein
MSVPRRPLRCRLGLHRWAQFKQLDMDLFDPGRGAIWMWRCRDCGRERRSGLAFIVEVSCALVIGGGVLWWLVSPTLGLALLVAAAIGLAWAARIAFYGDPSRRIPLR